MRRHRRSLLLSSLAAVLAAAVVFAGCGRAQAPDERAEAVPSPIPADPDLEAVEARLAEREAAVERRETEVRRLARETDTRIRAMQDLLADTRSQEPPRPEPVESRASHLPPPAETPRLAAPREEPVFRPRTVTVAIPASTELPLTLVDPLSSERNRVGDRVRAEVARDIVADGFIAIPAGSEVLGAVVEIEPEKKIGGQARLSVLFEEIRTPAGYTAAIQATLDAAGRPQKKKDAATIGGAAAGGAVLGRVLGKDKTKATVIGGLLGAAAGAVAARENRGDPVEIEAGASVSVPLELPLHVAVADDGERPVVARASGS